MSAAVASSAPCPPLACARHGRTLSVFRACSSHGDTKTAARPRGTLARAASRSAAASSSPSRNATKAPPRPRYTLSMLIDSAGRNGNFTSPQWPANTRRVCQPAERREVRLQRVGACVARVDPDPRLLEDAGERVRVGPGRAAADCSDGAAAVVCEDERVRCLSHRVDHGRVWGARLVVCGGRRVPFREPSREHVGVLGSLVTHQRHEHVRHLLWRSRAKERTSALVAAAT
jgi:hypothetical protein